MSPVTRDHETLDELREYDLQIIQARHGYRFSLDPLLLCDFVAGDEVTSVIDLGTGCGIIPLVLARKIGNRISVVGVESQAEMAETALRNVELNRLNDRISIMHMDVLGLKDQFPVSSFDLVVANPPYRRPGTGRISPKPGRDKARHETSATLSDFLAAAKYLVKQSGKICFIYHPSRLAEFLVEAAAQKLAPLRLRAVHGYVDAEAGIFLVELAKDSRGGLKVLPPLIMRDRGL